MTDLLSRQEINSLVDDHPKWQLDDQARPTCLIRTWKFNDFAEAYGFLTKIALLAEKLDHHPDIHLHYNKLTLNLTSHDSKGLTTRDAKFIHRLAA
ncbi:MAG: 4a-hydroxytetrahydrobiopterin dehydratase [Alphaproteobacteria bacterium]